MKLLHVYRDYYPPTHGGIEQHVHDLVHALPAHECAVLTGSRSRSRATHDDDGVDVIRSREYTPLRLTPSWLHELRTTEAELVHLHMPTGFGEVALAVSRLRLPMVASYHADIVGRTLARPFFARVQHRVLKRARNVIVGSPVLLETSAMLDPHRSRCVVIPYGVDAAEWEIRPRGADDIRARYAGPIVLFLGRLVYYKGLEVLIEAIRHIDATLLIVGAGPHRRQLEAKRSRANVVLVGEVDDRDRAAYYHAADVFALPSTSRAESFGIAMLEAMACGTPAVSTEVGTGTSWLNQHRETGLVVAPRDPRALADAIQTVLADRALRDDLGNAAAARAREHFPRSAMLKDLADVYSAAHAG